MCHRLGISAPAGSGVSWLLIVFSFIATFTPSFLAAQRLRPPASDAPSIDQIAPLDLPPFEPETIRDEADEDRILSSALIAEARLRYQRDDFKNALARYQRAFRYSEAKSKIVAEILPIALRLKRVDEALRYIEESEIDSTVDPFVIRRLAIFLTDQRRFQEALRLYEHVRDQQTDLKSSSRMITHFEMGRLYFLVDDHKNAAESFRQVVSALEAPKKYNLQDDDKKALLRNPEVAYGVMAESFLSGEYLDLSEKYFRKAFEADKNQAFLDFNLARIAYRKKDYKTAKRNLNRYVDSKSLDAGTEVFTLLNDILKAELGDPQKAQQQYIQRLEEIAKSDSKNVMAGYSLARAYLANEDFNAAEKKFNQLMETHPLLDGSKGLIKVYIHTKNAERLFSNLTDIYRNTGALNSISDSVASISKDQKLAKGLVEYAQKRIRQNDLAMNLTAAEIAIKSQQFDAASVFFNTAINQFRKKSDAADVVIAWGVDLLIAEQNERSKKVFQQVIQDYDSKSKKAEAYYHLAGILALEHQVDDAVAAIEKAIQLAPDFAQFQLRRGWIYYFNSRYDEAKREYEAFHKKFKDNFEQPGLRLLLSDARMSLSNINVVNRNIEMAVEWLELVLDEFPGDIGAHNDLGYLWADEGIHLNRALAMAKRAAEAEPDNYAYRDSYGWALYKLGRINEAIEQLKKATDVDEPDGIVLDHLGDAYLKSGNKTLAQDYWRRALKALPDRMKKEREAVSTKLKETKAPE